MTVNLTPERKAQIEAAEYNRISNQFIQTCPDYYPSPEHAKILMDYLLSANLFLSVENLKFCYLALKTKGIDLSKPPAAPAAAVAPEAAPADGLTPSGIPFVDALTDYKQIKQMPSNIYKFWYFGSKQDAFRKRVAELTEKAGKTRAWDWRRPSSPNKEKE
jgi:hypothetical protein